MALLGISTNTRLLAVAIINQKGLAKYSIHLHRSPWSASKATMIVSSLEPCVRRYSIKKVVLSMPEKHHQTREHKMLIAAIRSYFTEKNIPVHTEPLETFYSFCPAGQKRSKKAVMRSLVQRFPELQYCYEKELRNKRRYYIKIFEAVAVALFRHERN